LYPNYGRKYV